MEMLWLKWLSYAFFPKNERKGILPITDKKMTRFNISLEDGCQMVFDAIENAWGGELFVPKYHHTE